MMRATKLPSAAERTSFSNLDVPTRNIATVASAIGLPDWSRIIPLITPRFELTPTVGVDGASATGTDPNTGGTAVVKTSSEAIEVFFIAATIIPKTPTVKTEEPSEILRSWSHFGQLQYFPAI